jgi:hypothetical protein
LNRLIKLPAIPLFFAAVFALRGADLTGTWAADVALDAGSGTATFVFEQKPRRGNLWVTEGSTVWFG